MEETIAAFFYRLVVCNQLILVIAQAVFYLVGLLWASVTGFSTVRIALMFVTAVALLIDNKTVSCNRFFYRIVEHPDL